MKGGTSCVPFFITFPVPRPVFGIQYIFVDCIAACLELKPLDTESQLSCSLCLIECFPLVHTDSHCCSNIPLNLADITWLSLQRCGDDHSSTYNDDPTHPGLS